MWSEDEIARLALEALCLLVGTAVASVIARRKGLAMGTLTGFMAGCTLWIAMLLVQLRWFANWQ